MPLELYDTYTLNGQIAVRNLYVDDSNNSSLHLVYETDVINRFITSAKRYERYYYGITDQFLYAALIKYSSNINGKTVGIIGSVTPWYECIILAYGGKPITIDYNRIICNDPRIQTMTVDEYQKNPVKFDVIVSISSIEHDGLGRYGDPLNPNGDLEAMKSMKSMLKDGGLLFLSVPVEALAKIRNHLGCFGKFSKKASKFY